MMPPRLLPNIMYRPSLLLPALCLSLTSHAAPLTILAEEWPPFVYADASERPAGMLVDIVTALQARTGDIAPMQWHDWEQAMAVMDSQPHHMMFTLGNTPDNRSRYVQLGPIMYASVQAYALSAQAAILSGWPDARLYREPAVAAVGSIAAAAANEAGLKTLPTRDGEQGLRLLLANRARLWVEANTVVATQLRLLGQPVDSVGSVRLLHSLPLYLTFSAGTPADTVTRWQQALQGMLQDGSYRDIHQHWLPQEAPVTRIRVLQPGEPDPEASAPKAPDMASAPATEAPATSTMPPPP